MLLGLLRDGLVLDFGICCQQKCLAEDYGQGAITFEGQQDFVLLLSLPGHDAKILVIGLHKNVAASQMDLVSAQLATHDEELFIKPALCGNFESRKEALQNFLARFGRGVEVTEGIALPVIAETPFRSAVIPSRVIADAGYANEHVHIPHDLGENKRRDFLQRQRLGSISAVSRMVAAATRVGRALRRIQAIKPNLVGGKAQEHARIIAN